VDSGSRRDIEDHLIFQFGLAPEWETEAVGRLVDQGCILFENLPEQDPHFAVSLSFWYP
jgi:hypothetical protein